MSSTTLELQSFLSKMEEVLKLIVSEFDVPWKVFHENQIGYLE